MVPLPRAKRRWEILRGVLAMVLGAALVAAAYGVILLAEGWTRLAGVLLLAGGATLLGGLYFFVVSCLAALRR